MWADDGIFRQQSEGHGRQKKTQKKTKQKPGNSHSAFLFPVKQTGQTTRPSRLRRHVSAASQSQVIALEFFLFAFVENFTISRKSKFQIPNKADMNEWETGLFQGSPVEDLVREVLARPLERTSHDALHPLAHLLSDQLLEIQPVPSLLLISNALGFFLFVCLFK